MTRRLAFNGAPTRSATPSRASTVAGALLNVPSRDIKPPHRASARPAAHLTPTRFAYCSGKLQ